MNNQQEARDKAFADKHHDCLREIIAGLTSALAKGDWEVVEVLSRAYQRIVSVGGA